MKTIKIIRVVILFCFLLVNFSTKVHAQKYLEILEKSKSKDFKKIVKEAEAYYEKIEKRREREKAKKGAEAEDEGEEYNLFQRWKYLNSRRLTSDGKIQNYTAKNFEEYNKYEAKRKSLKTSAATTSGNWTALGPTSSINGPRGYSRGQGRVNCITIDPANSSIIYIGTPGGGIWKSTTGGNSWIPLSDGLTAIGVAGIVIDPSSPAGNRTIYILTGDGDSGNKNSLGVLKSTDGGANWLSTGLSWTINQYVHGRKLAIHPTNPSILFALTNQGIYKTSDAGLNWTLVLSGNFVDIEFQPGNSATIYIGAYNGSVYKSTNIGTNWSLLSPGGPSGSRIALAVSAANPNYLYVLYAGVPSAGMYSGLYRSTDAGATFSLRSNTPNIYGLSTNGSGTADQSWYDQGLAVSPTNAEEVHAAGINCWKSTDGGVTFLSSSDWIEPNAGVKYVHADIHALDFYGSTLYCGSDGGIFKSTDNAATWQDLSTGLAITEMYRVGVDRLNPAKICYGAQDNGLNFLQNSLGTQWYGGDGLETCIDYTNSNIIYGMNQYGNFLRTDDNGQTLVGIRPLSGGGATWLTPFVMHPNNPQTLYAGYTDVCKTTDKGTTWSNISNGLIGTGACDHLEIAPSNTNYIYVSKNMTALYKTTNGGTSWTSISTGLPAQTITYFAVDPNNPDAICVSLGGYSSGQKVYQTNNGGASWVNISGSLPNLPANCIVATGNNNGMYIGMDAGVYYRDASMSDWIIFSNGLPNAMIHELKINPVTFKLVAATYGRGAWQSDLYAPCAGPYVFSGTQTGTQAFISSSTISSSAQITGISNVQYIANSAITLTNGFSSYGVFNNVFKGAIAPCAGNLKIADLSGVYGGLMSDVSNVISDPEFISENIKAIPNPFSVTTTIQFVLKEDMPVTLTITDMLGNVIETLIKDKQHAAGIYSIPFNGNNLSTGLYLCILKTKEKNEVAKIIVSR